MAPQMGRFGRRDFLAIVGGGVASATLALGLWKYGQPSRLEQAPPLVTVDYSGWMVTSLDKERLTQAGNIKIMEDTVFVGYGMAAQRTATFEDCINWCLEQADCHGLSWAKPEHPDVTLRNRCLLKDNESPMTPSPDTNFRSGLR
jgi:hypothetical protein